MKQIFIFLFFISAFNSFAQKTNTEIYLKRAGGVYEVPVELNGVLKIDFVFDSGASEVSISPDVAMTLMRAKTIKESDWLPGQYYTFADGSSAKSVRFKLSSVKIGNKIIYDVNCSISNSIEAPMLLGQSALKKFGKYTFDYENEKLIFGIERNVYHPEQVKDIDGNIYNTVKIGKQVWMVENLKVTRYRNGNAIPNVTDETAWRNLTTGAYCNYGNKIGNAIIYGRLYNWYAVSDPRGLSPKGWHIATDEEWTTLINFLGGESITGEKLKEAGLAHWISPNTGATNESGFTALPGDLRDYHGWFNNYIGTKGHWWSSTEDDTTYSWVRYMYYNFGGVNRYLNNKKNGFSVRCVWDN
jgi:uncharacterized protein (TIGR02145 family)